MSLITAILAVFTSVGDWIISQLDALQVIFWTTTDGVVQLTFLGVLAVAGLAFSVVFLIIGIIQRFLHFRG